MKSKEISLIILLNLY